MTTSQIASSAFTWGTAAVLPFYTLMVVAPNANIVSIPPLLHWQLRRDCHSSVSSRPPHSFVQTKRTAESSAPYVALGLLYGYLLYLSWTPDTLRAMFSSKYWLPEVVLVLNNSLRDRVLCSTAITAGCSNSIVNSNRLSECSAFCAVAGHRQDVRKRDDRRLCLDPPSRRRPVRCKVGHN
jgi:hypothetical protein